ncbi:DNA repair protein rad51 homolog 3 [Plakobranchus ocellatus]|uniref:DNA repair protein RAD51 homolog 3 n=1 Tax=Plakobranchus ocellatus TaxID=259542 RepID=A0AAV4C0V1_9GAST|nr:DNA repair protein rad51 homolog 3 [Plakobranchus ocellatus]
MSYSREITTFPLNPVVMGKLLQVGFNLASSLISLSPVNISLSAGISVDEAKQVLKIVQEDVNTCLQISGECVAKSAFDLLCAEQEQEHIVTFCEAVDSMLGGGVPVCKLTEICGAPGMGKTQLCLQLAVDVHIPEHLGGVEGEAVYIDTEGGLILDRLVELARSAVLHCQQVVEASQSTLDQSSHALTVDKILGGIHCFRCHDYYELIAAVQLLPTLLTQNEKIKLVVVDSLASPFRHNMDDMSLRRRLLATLAQSFLRVAANFKTAVVLTNQMTTKIMPREGDSHHIPALGDNWAHVSHNRIVLTRDCSNNKRKASLYKGPNKKEELCFFQITLKAVANSWLCVSKLFGSSSKLELVHVIHGAHHALV